MSSNDNAHINQRQMYPLQLSIHALNTTTQGDITQITTYERPFTHEGNYLVGLSCYSGIVALCVLSGVLSVSEEQGCAA